MTASADNPQCLCPECGASCPTDAPRCWLCQRDLKSSGENPFAPSAAIGPHAEPAAGQFSIATVLLVTTLVAVCLGVFRLSPGFGLAMIAFSAPALIRTFIVGVRYKQTGQRLSIGEELPASGAAMRSMSA